MNNGCICCTVRGDLIRIIDGLMKRKGKFDAIIVETTGLADPAPVAQTFFVDQDVSDAAKLDAVVTVVDAKWLTDRLKDAPEAKNQIAFADVIVLNKTDLVSAGRARRGRGAHPRDQPLCHASTGPRTAQVPIAEVLDRNAFDLDRIIEIEPDFLEEGHHHHHDEDMQSLSVRHPGEVDPGEVHALDLGPDPARGAEHPALQGHRRLPERAEALRLPGRAHDPRRGPAAATGRKARSANPASSSSAATSTRRRSARVFSARRRDCERSSASMSPTEVAPSLTEHVTPVEAGAHVDRGRLARRRRRLRARRRRASCSPRTARRIASRPIRTPACSSRPATGSASSRGATTGASRSPARTARRASSPRPAAPGSTRSRSIPAARSPGAPASASRHATTRAARRSSRRPRRVRGLAFAPKGYRLAIEPLQRRDAVVPEPRDQARGARMEGLASRRDLVAGRALRRHLDAGERRCTAGASSRTRATCACRGYPGEDALLVLVA